MNNKFYKLFFKLPIEIRNKIITYRPKHKLAEMMQPHIDKWKSRIKFINKHCKNEIPLDFYSFEFFNTRFISCKYTENLYDNVFNIEFYYIYDYFYGDLEIVEMFLSEIINIIDQHEHLLNSNKYIVNICQIKIRLESLYYRLNYVIDYYNKTFHYKFMTYSNKYDNNLSLYLENDIEFNVYHMNQ